MTLWSKVVTHPLGLGAFALFLVFSYLYWHFEKNKSVPRWLGRTAIGLATITLIGSLVLGYFETVKSSAPSVQIPKPTQVAPTQTNPEVRQETSGPGSPAVQGTQGDVNITVDQSTGKSEPQKQPVKKPKARTEPGTN